MNEVTKMAIQRYSKNEMEAIISNILKKNIELLPIGNHELRRHLVYQVKTQDGDFVFKYYYQDTYGGREISTLKLLKNSTIKHAPLIDYGTFGEAREWLMMTLLEGIAMDKIQDDKANCLNIYKEMGEELAKLHEHKLFDGFGDLQANGQFIQSKVSFKKAFLDSHQYVFNKIKNSDLEAKDFLIHGIQTIENNLHLLEDIKEARLTHFDYSPRNIFVSENKIGYELKAVLDFELCRPWDKNYDFTQLFLKDFSEHPDIEEAFFRGYKTFSHVDPSFHKTIDLYLLSLCIHVCSWSKDIAPIYYQRAYNKLLSLLTASKNFR